MNESDIPISILPTQYAIIQMNNQPSLDATLVPSALPNNMISETTHQDTDAVTETINSVSPHFDIETKSSLTSSSLSCLESKKQDSNNIDEASQHHPILPSFTPSLPTHSSSRHAETTNSSPSMQLLATSNKTTIAAGKKSKTPWVNSVVQNIFAQLFQKPVLGSLQIEFELCPSVDQSQSKDMDDIQDKTVGSGPCSGPGTTHYHSTKGMNTERIFHEIKQEHLGEGQLVERIREHLMIPLSKYKQKHAASWSNSSNATKSNATITNNSGVASITPSENNMDQSSEYETFEVPTKLTSGKIIEQVENTLEWLFQTDIEGFNLSDFCQFIVGISISSTSPWDLYLTHIPSYIYSLSYLKKLKLEHNNITELPASLFSKLAYLEELDLSCNKIKSILKSDPNAPAKTLTKTKNAPVLDTLTTSSNLPVTMVEDAKQKPLEQLTNASTSNSEMLSEKIMVQDDGEDVHPYSLSSITNQDDHLSPKEADKLNKASSSPIGDLVNGSFLTKLDGLSVSSSSIPTSMNQLDPMFCPLFDQLSLKHDSTRSLGEQENNTVFSNMNHDHTASFTFQDLSITSHEEEEEEALTQVMSIKRTTLPSKNKNEVSQISSSFESSNTLFPLDSTVLTLLEPVITAPSKTILSDPSSLMQEVVATKNDTSKDRFQSSPSDLEGYKPLDTTLKAFDDLTANTKPIDIPIVSSHFSNLNGLDQKSASFNGIYVNYTYTSAEQALKVDDHLITTSSSPSLITGSITSHGLTPMTEYSNSNPPNLMTSLNQPIQLNLKNPTNTIDEAEKEAGTNLQTLILRSNIISSLPPLLFSFTKLVSLDLSCNKLMSLPDEIGQLQNLTHLNIEMNLIRSLPPSFSTLRLLHSFNWSSNCIVAPLRILGFQVPATSEPMVVSNISPFIPEICLAKNLLLKIPKFFTASANYIKTLDLSYNEIDQIAEEEAMSFFRLKFADLSHNRLQSLPFYLFILSRLEFIDLSYNELKHLFSDFDQHLKNRNQEMNVESSDSLILIPNRLSIQDQLTEVGSHLQYVDLSHNSLTKFPSELANFKSIKVLKLSHNRIQCDTIDESWGGIPSLEHLDLSNNMIRHVPNSISLFLFIRHLNLSFNALQTLPNTIHKCRHLEKLELHGAGNRAIELPSSFARLTKISRLSILDRTLLQSEEPASYGPTQVFLKYQMMDVDNHNAPEKSGNATGKNTNTTTGTVESNTNEKEGKTNLICSATDILRIAKQAPHHLFLYAIYMMTKNISNHAELIEHGFIDLFIRICRFNSDEEMDGDMLETEKLDESQREAMLSNQGKEKMDTNSSRLNEYDLERDEQVHLQSIACNPKDDIYINREIASSSQSVLPCTISNTNQENESEYIDLDSSAQRIQSVDDNQLLDNTPLLDLKIGEKGSHTSESNSNNLTCKTVDPTPMTPTFLPPQSSLQSAGTKEEDMRIQHLKLLAHGLFQFQPDRIYALFALHSLVQNPANPRSTFLNVLPILNDILQYQSQWLDNFYAKDKSMLALHTICHFDDVIMVPSKVPRDEDEGDNNDQEHNIKERLDIFDAILDCSSHLPINFQRYHYPYRQFLSHITMRPSSREIGRSSFASHMQFPSYMNRNPASRPTSSKESHESFSSISSPSSSSLSSSQLPLSPLTHHLYSSYIGIKHLVRTMLDTIMFLTMDNNLRKTCYNSIVPSTTMISDGLTIPNRITQILKHPDPHLEGQARRTAACLGIAPQLYPKARGIRILALDGGGTRGLTTVLLLTRLEEMAGRPISELFDLIVGTSTGGLIASMATWRKQSMAECRLYYRELCKCIFHPKGVALEPVNLPSSSSTNLLSIQNLSANDDFHFLEVNHFPPIGRSESTSATIGSSKSKCYSLKESSLNTSTGQLLSLVNSRTNLNMVAKSIPYSSSKSSLYSLSPSFSSSDINLSFTSSVPSLPSMSPPAIMVQNVKISTQNKTVSTSSSSLPVDGSSANLTSNKSDFLFPWQHLHSLFHLIYSGAYYDSKAFEDLISLLGGNTVSLLDTTMATTVRLALTSTQINAFPTQPFILRNYNHKDDMASFFSGTSALNMSQALRATAAVPGYFDPVVFGDYELADGALLHNNPSTIAIKEARAIWPGKPISILLSCGVGMRPTKATKSSILQLLSCVIDGCSETEKTHQLMEELLPPGVYHRLQPCDEVFACPINETSKTKFDAIEEYISQWVVKNDALFKQIVAQLTNNQDIQDDLSKPINSEQISEIHINSQYGENKPKTDFLVPSYDALQRDLHGGHSTRFKRESYGVKCLRHCYKRGYLF